MSPLTSFMDSLLDDSCSSFEILDDNAKVPSDARVPLSPSTHDHNSSMKRLDRWDCYCQERKFGGASIGGSNETHLVTPKRCHSPKRFDKDCSDSCGLRMPLRSLHLVASAQSVEYPFEDDSEDDVNEDDLLHPRGTPDPVSAIELVEEALKVCQTVTLRERYSEH